MRMRMMNRHLYDTFHPGTTFNLFNNKILKKTVQIILYFLTMFDSYFTMCVELFAVYAILSS